jgi:antitoxin component YwqK of YwqJK toxin-antitoxin module
MKQNKRPIGLLSGLIGVLCFWLVSCKNTINEEDTNQRHADSLPVLKRYYPNGAIKSEGTYLSDTINHGWYKLYYPSGAIRATIQYKNGVKDGLRRYYFENGRIESSVYFEDDKKEGRAFWYYENGNLRLDCFYFKDRFFGDSKYYYPNGKLKSYKCYNFMGECFYSESYDEFGKKVKEEGMVLSPSFSSPYTNDSIPIGEEIDIKIAVTHPPGTKTTIKVGEILNCCGIKYIKEFPPALTNIFTFKKSFKDAGKSRIAVIGELEDLQGKIIKSDTVFTDIHVIDL